MRSLGAIIAFVVIGVWGAALIALLSAPIDVRWAPAAVVLMTFLHTGLFITAHDAMHGTVVPGSPRANAAIGTLAVTLYALFSFRKLREKHAEHHGHPGHAGHDPDFHDGRHPSFWRWYLHFVRNYVGILQILGMAAVYNVLAHVVGVAERNLIAFWVAPALLSTLQLFYFGTYLPHREPHSADDPHRARSNEYPPWLSFITCYHFGYHREHHEKPGVPWWRLPGVRGPRAAS